MGVLLANRENMADLDVDAGRADYEGCAAARRETVFGLTGETAEFGTGVPAVEF
jgi:hypothetical protein